MNESSKRRNRYWQAAAREQDVCTQQYLQERVIEEEEKVLAGFSQEVGGHVVLQLPGLHALHAGPPPLHPIQSKQRVHDGCPSIQELCILRRLHVMVIPLLLCCPNQP